MNIEVPTKYPLSHNARTVVLEIRLHSESPMLYRPALHGNWNALSLARRAIKDKFPTPTIPLTALLPNRQVFLPEPVSSNQQNTGASFLVFPLFEKTHILDVDFKFKLRRVEHIPDGNSDTVATGNW